MADTVHNPDRYMLDFRQILAQGRKRIGVLMGAGTPVSIRVNADGDIDPKGNALIPAIAELTGKVLANLPKDHSKVVEAICKELINSPNIEMILSRIRSYGEFVGAHQINGYNGQQYKDLAADICKQIGEIVSAKLPSQQNSYSELIAWIAGVDRPHPVEIFTPNYDLLLEEAMERSQVPYFDGFVGAAEPFFDSSTTSKNDLPSRWVRLWKLHGSLGWGRNTNGELIRGLGRSATECIFPDHMKYEQTQKMPYTAFFDRLRAFLMVPDTLLISSGFSYFDAHISAVIEESLAANPAASVFAFQHGGLDDQEYASKIAFRRPNMSVYAADKAVISGVKAPWRPGEPLNRDWAAIRSNYWAEKTDGTGSCFTLGGFQEFARFLALSQSEQVEAAEEPPESVLS